MSDIAAKPVRIQRSRTRGWRMPANTVYVGRGSEWGNPFWIDRMGGLYVIQTDRSQKCNDILMRANLRVVHEDKVEAQKVAVALYDLYLVPDTGNNIMQYYAAVEKLEEMIGKLKGKNLACWCKPGDPCHADILLGLANK